MNGHGLSKWFIISSLAVLFFMYLSSFSIIAQVPPAVKHKKPPHPASHNVNTPQIPPPKPTREARQTTDGILDISQTVVNESGTIDNVNNLATNGNYLTYTITIANISDNPIYDMQVFDVIPRNAIERNTIACSDGCEITYETISVDAVGNPITVAREITWTFQALQPNERVELYFSGRLICQSEGNIIENGVFLNYFNENIPLSDSNIARRTTTAGTPSLGNLNLTGPTWCSFGSEVGLDIDWGDYDEDGDLDLALGTFYGAVVYRNDNGQLQPFWRNSDYTSGVRWIEAIPNNGSLELITVGRSENADAGAPGINYVYQLDTNGFSEVGDETPGVGDFRRSDTGIWRIAVADYDGDGDLDLATAKNDVANNSCLIRMYRNNGSGQFQNDGCVMTMNLPTYFWVNSMAWGDYDNDGDPDLLVSGYNDTYEGGFAGLLENTGNTLAPISTLESGDVYDATDVSWGDYNEDGYLDIAITIYFAQEIRVYPNQQGSFDPNTYLSISTVASGNQDYAATVEWADINQDGHLELIYTTDSGFVSIYRYIKDENKFVLVSEFDTGQRDIQFWSMRSGDFDNDGDLDLAVANAYQSVLFLNFGLMLNTEQDVSIPGSQAACSNQPQTARTAASLDWADFDGDNDLDVILGAHADSGALGTILYENRDQQFCQEENFSGLGPRFVAFGDVNNDYRMDFSIVDRDRSLVYLADNTTVPSFNVDNSLNLSVAWGDSNDDGSLELLIARAQALEIYETPMSDSTGTLLWNTTTPYVSTEVAWGDFNRDRFLDFVVANIDGPTQIYCNNRDNTFSLIWSSSRSYRTTSVAVADYDGDGDLDLAEGNTNQTNRIYENQLCDGGTCNSKLPYETSAISCKNSLSFNVFTLPDYEKTRADVNIESVKLAWGDVNNNGILDLAVGNNGEADFIYNLSTDNTGTTVVDVNWIAETISTTSDIAWGDYDGDGDLDLGITAEDKTANGIYVNNYVNPKALLPNNPPYVYIRRPGLTYNGYKYSVGNEFLSGATSPTVTIRYWVNDPDGDGIEHTTFDYSINGGSTWFPATPAITPTTIISPSLLGQELNFLWDAQQDEAISDQALFRITIQSHIGRVSSKDSSVYRYGFNQRSTISAISPPFRVRGLTCVWPENPSYTWRVTGDSSITQPALGDVVEFIGRVNSASQGLTFNWTFDNNVVVTGQVIRHTFTRNNNEPIQLTVTSESCPIAKSVYVNGNIQIGTGYADTHLPHITNGATTSARQHTMVQKHLVASPTLPQVTNLTGTITNQSTQLTWSSVISQTDIEGYRVYRLGQTDTAPFELIATIPSTTLHYTDTTANCGEMYYITTFNGSHESNASYQSYFSPPCSAK